MYNISEIEEIRGDNDYGKVLIFLKGEREAIECNSIDFDHITGTFTIN